MQAIKNKLRLEYLDPKTLEDNPKNWRRHPESQIAVLQDVLKEVGWAGALLYNEQTSRLIDGHARKELAIKLGINAVPVLIGSWDDSAEAKALATIDPIAAMAETDAAALDNLLSEIKTQSESISSMLADMAEAAGVTPKEYGSEPGDGGDEFNVTPEMLPERGCVGDLWVIGDKHRLLVGDCTIAKNVKRLMGGDKAEMVWTDPPYGVAIGDKNKFLNTIAFCNRVEENLINDSLDEAGLAKMLDGAFDNAILHCKPGAAWYVACPGGPLHILFEVAMHTRGMFRQTLIWVKNNATFSPMGVSYHWRHEPILYGWVPNGPHRYHGDRKQDTVWEIDRPMASPDHPTMKPIELVSRAISHSSLKGEIVYDPFLGSGTTLIAAHRLGRVCYGCEIDPVYADVILKRAEAEGLTVEKSQPEVILRGSHE